VGVIDLLNEEAMRPRGRDDPDENFVGKLRAAHGSTHGDASVGRLGFSKRSRSHFFIQHYAGKVQYDASGFLEKHKDALLPAIGALLASSSDPLVRRMFPKGPAHGAAAGAAASAAAGSPAGGKLFAAKGRARRNMRSSALQTSTVGTQFKQSLGELLREIGRTQTHYVRCIKPNAQKQPGRFERRLVVQQLRCAGVMAAIRIARSASPSWLAHEDAWLRFQLLAVASVRLRRRNAASGDGGEVEDGGGEWDYGGAVRNLLSRAKLRDPEDYQVRG
jgi:myosin-5